MNRPDLLWHTWSVLIEGYKNGTLCANSDERCLVAHLVSAAYALGIDPDTPRGHWPLAITQHYAQVFGLDTTLTSSEKMLMADATREIRATRYAVYELAQLEEAFSAPFQRERGAASPDRLRQLQGDEPELVHEGLCNVIHILAELHGAQEDVIHDMSMHLTAMR
jgi:hypothetical protein